MRSTNFTNLSRLELKKIVAAGLQKLTARPELGPELFEAIIKIVPQIAVEALVVDNLENPKEILLTWREDKYYRGWHFPGGFIRFGETPEQRLKRTVLKELGVPLKRYRDTNYKYTHIGPRGHTVGLVYLVELKKPRTKSGQWFKKTPPELLDFHKKIFYAVLGRF